MSVQKKYSDASMASDVDQGLRQYMSKVYNYMATGLGVTGLVAMLVSSSPALMAAIFGTPIGFLFMLAPLGMVMFMSFRVNKMSMGALRRTFFIYSALMGVSMSTIFLTYTGESIARVFFLSAITFLTMSIYGYATKKDLTGMGSFLFMGLIGVILASIVNWFVGSTALQFALSVITVLVFTGLTAYDTQKLKMTYRQFAGTGEMLGKTALMGALSLYLDFINIFVSLLHLLGDRR